MRPDNKHGYIFILTEDESAAIDEIAERDGISREKAMEQAIENFLKRGVQTPDRVRRCA